MIFHPEVAKQVGHAMVVEWFELERKSPPRRFACHRDDLHRTGLRRAAAVEIERRVELDGGPVQIVEHEKLGVAGLDLAAQRGEPRRERRQKFVRKRQDSGRRAAQQRRGHQRSCQVTLARPAGTDHVAHACCGGAEELLEELLATNGRKPRITGERGSIMSSAERTQKLFGARGAILRMLRDESRDDVGEARQKPGGEVAQRATAGRSVNATGATPPRQRSQREQIRRYAGAPARQELGGRILSGCRPNFVSCRENARGPPIPDRAMLRARRPRSGHAPASSRHG